ICTPWPAYEEIGVLKGDEYRQVNTSILQSEAEFYTTIRAKCVPPKGANFLKVLLGGGVEYVEIRLLDVNPFAPLGIDADTIHFLEVLLLHCLLSTSSRMEDEECDASTANVQQVVYGGREPETMLDDRGTARGVKEWGLDIIRAMEPLAHTMDKAQGTTLFTRTLDSQRDKLVDAELTPSAQVLNDMKSQSVPFFRFAMNKAIAHQQYFRNLPMSTERQQYYRDLAEQSRMDQKKIEAGDVLPFDKYLERLNREYRDLIN
ncbi:MAG TPA: glutamate--cysteine ligase, partial [Pseudomonadales bacterium]|nr:glutamate--cysteine ligase [Pseudomonadales bacterium]